MFKDIPVDVGIIFEGQRIRWNDTQLELGGPKQKHKFELVRVKEIDEIEDGKLIIVGPDLKDLVPGASFPFGLLVEIAGKDLDHELEGVVERRLHEYVNYIEGFMHVNQRGDIQYRLSKKSYEKGFNSLTYLGKVLERLYRSELPFIEKIQITFITNPRKVKELYTEAVEIYNARDAKARGMKDEEADSFYGCTLCQSFAPTHCCIITPQRYSNCGAISWFDGKAAARADPKGPLFKIEVGECIDPLKGEYAGVKKLLVEKTLGAVKRVQLYTAFDYPHTSCGCFEAVAFYIPEVDGLGLVHRDFKGQTVDGLSFSTLADSTSGGRQVNGFHGISIEYLRSTKFLQVDGGWNRIVWMPSIIKERVKEFIPKDVVDKIATENDALTIDQLKISLENKGHPVVERWKAIREAEASHGASHVPVIGSETAELQVIPANGISFNSGGYKIILKDAKIVAKRLIIKRIEP
ncbi:CO dehydrogenase/CO-methylating acetyl-CoA synthase complex subunit beta [Candidatus Bathyarchaeota archaeon]|nr:CO dehydrogenase/CO-methylating acetyl-CoA synthase complex subunit beta [Candidatus Bathyarchaeota archaeon]